VKIAVTALITLNWKDAKELLCYILLK